MKRSISTRSTALIATLLLGLGLGAASAQEEQEVPLNIFGFGDFQYLGGQDRFAPGQVEVALETPLHEHIDLAMAIALEEGSFGMGSFIVDFHLFGNEGYHFRPATGIDHSGILVGQLDVPFGLDWLVYPSIDRKLVSGPIAVENTHDFWNDHGIQGYLESGRINAVAYAVNGFGYEAAGAEVEMNLAVGGRVGISLHPQLEIGGSAVGIFDQDYEVDMSLLGADLQFDYDRFSAKGEYLIHTLGLAGDREVNNTGFYAQGLYDAGPFFLVARYGQFRPDAAENLTRFSAGGGWVIQDSCEMRLEQQINSAGEEDLTLLQLAVGF